MCVIVLWQSEMFVLGRMSEVAECKLNIPVPDAKFVNHEVC